MSTVVKSWDNGLGAPILLEVDRDSDYASLSIDDSAYEALLTVDEAIDLAAALVAWAMVVAERADES